MGSTQRAKSNGFLMAVCCGQRPAYGCRVPGWRRRQELLMSVCDRLAARRGAETARDFAQARAGDLERKRTRGSELGAARLALACLMAVPAACCLLSLLAGTSLPPPHLQKEIVYPGRAGTSPGYEPFLARPVCARAPPPEARAPLSFPVLVQALWPVPPVTPRVSRFKRLKFKNGFR